MKEIQPHGYTHCTPLNLHLTMVKSTPLLYLSRWGTFCLLPVFPESAADIVSFWTLDF